MTLKEFANDIRLLTRKITSTSYETKNDYEKGQHAAILWISEELDYTKSINKIISELKEELRKTKNQEPAIDAYDLGIVTIILYLLFNILHNKEEK